MGGAGDLNSDRKRPRLTVCQVSVAPPNSIKFSKHLNIPFYAEFSSGYHRLAYSYCFFILANLL